MRRILDLLPRERQNLLFSATMSREVLKVVESTLHDPVYVEASPSTKPIESIKQSVYPVCRTQKTDLLVELLRDADHTRTLVFTRTKHRADRLSRQLTRKGVRSEAIHGDRSQGQRQKALEAFKSGRAHVLVATDVVARGIDIDEISHVVNYDMPNTTEDYVHRIGRTARAGADGTAISFLSAEEFETLTAIERALGTTLACEDLAGFAYVARSLPDPERTAVPAAAAARTGAKRNGRRGGRGRTRR
ncbi:MAG: DEAD/DEAH box helicase [Bacteroidales bacterium]